MFKKKIIASALVWSLFLGSFGNIFANSDQLAVEKKICDDIKIQKEKILKWEPYNDWLYEISINNNNFYYRIWIEEYKNLEKEDSFHKYIYEKNLKNYEEEETYENNIKKIIIKIDWNSFERSLKDNEDLNFIKKLWNDYYYIISKFETAWRVVISGKSEFYKNNEKIFETENNKYISDALVDNSWNIYYVETFDLNQTDTDPEHIGYNLFEATTYKILNWNKEKLNKYKKLRYYNDASEWHSLDFLNFYELNNDIYFIHSKGLADKSFNILKNWKPLCENLENNNWNSGNQNWNSWNQNSSNQNSSNQSSSWNSWSTPASSSNITIKNDERVVSSSENTVKTVKSEDKNENKKEDLKSKTFTENEKNDVKDLVSNIIKKYSQSKDTLDSIYKALTTREDIKKMAENNPRIKFVIEEFTKQYIIFSVWR